MGLLLVCYVAISYNLFRLHDELRNIKLCYFGDKDVVMAKSPISVLFAVVQDLKSM